jgi:hypothetical protein
LGCEHRLINNYAAKQKMFSQLLNRHGSIAAMAGHARPLQAILALAEAIPYPHRAFRNCVASNLLSEVRHIVQVELWTDKQVLREKELNAKTCMHLEMVRIADGLRNVGAHRSPYARIL